jgi:hypothetical protein
MREDEITDIADVDNEPQQKLVTRFVQDAYDFVLKAHNWNSQRKEWKIPIIEGQNIYELPVSSEGASVYSVELKDDCNKKNDMIEVDAPGMARLDECQTGVPYYYAPSRVVNGKLGLEIWPMPVIPKEPEEGGGTGGGCPCSCGETTVDPLECSPGVITGGLYPGDFPSADAQGVYTNYDGSKGRTSFWQFGAPRTEPLAANLMPDFQLEPDSGVFYKGWSNQSTSYDAYQYAHVDPDKGVEGRPAPTKANPFEEVYEFACLLGYVDNYNSQNRALEVPGTPAQLYNGKVRFSMRGKIENDAHDIGVEACAFDLPIWREGNTIKYNTYAVSGGGQETRIAYIPESVMDPADKTCWISAKIKVNIDSEGVARDFYLNGESIGVLQTTLWVYSMDARADLYCNGVLIAEDIRVRSKSGYFPEARKTYTTAPCAAFTEPTEYYFRGHQNPPTYKSNDPYPCISLQNAYSGNQKPVLLFLDMGPGAVDLPNTELGKNLKRIDPNHTPAETCDCPAPPPPKSLGDSTQRPGPTIVDYTPDYYPVSRNADFTFEIDFFMESNILYQNLFTLGGNIEKKYGAIHAYSTNSNGLIINSSTSGLTTDGDSIFNWEPTQQGGVPINGTRRSIVIQKVGRSVSVWLDGAFYVNWPASSASEIEFPTNPFPGASLKLFSFADDSFITSPADGATIYGHRFTPGAGVYPMDAQTITPQYGPSAFATPLTTEEIPDTPIGDPIALTGDELVVNGYGMAPKLVANEDMCEIPDQVVLYYALSLASRERGEVGGMAAAEIFALSKQYLADAIARDIGNSRHEYTWETV